MSAAYSYPAAKIKVTNLHRSQLASFDAQYVFWLQISMRNTLLMKKV
jgi:hypothetical protein